MRLAAAIAVVVLLAAGAVASARPEARPAAARDPHAVTTRRAVLIARSVTPFRVVGSRFLAGERVRVTVTPTGGAGLVQRVTASRSGTFVLVYRGVHVCAGVSGKAAGSRGSRAAFSLSAIMC